MRVSPTLLALCPLAVLAPCYGAHATIDNDTNATTGNVPIDVAPSTASREIVTAITISPQLRAIAVPETIPSSVTLILEQRSSKPSIAPESSTVVAPTRTKPEAEPPAKVPSQSAIASSHIISSEAPLREVPAAVQSEPSTQATATKTATPNLKPDVLVTRSTKEASLLAEDGIRPSTQPLAIPKTVALVETQPAVDLDSPTSSVSQAAIDLLPPEPVAQLSPTDGLTEPGHHPVDAKPEPLNPEDTKDELGEVRILKHPTQQPTPRSQPDVQLLLRSGIFSSSNISALETFQPSDTVFSNTGLLLATPKLGPTTRLVAGAGGGAIRFATEGDFNYNVLNFNVGIQQRLTSQMYAQLGWVNEQLYRDGSGQRLLLDNAVDFTVGRQDQLGKQLRLDSFYNLRASFTNPTEQSRVVNTVGARLRYDFTPNFQGALDYRLTFKNFTDVNRFDTEHQISATATYSINPNLFIAGSVSYLFGNSSNSAIDVNNLSVGVVIGMNIPFGF